MAGDVFPDWRNSVQGDDHVARCGCAATGRYRGGFDPAGADVQSVSVVVEERTCGTYIVVALTTGAVRRGG